jgi:inner membrane protein
MQSIAFPFKMFMMFLLTFFLFLLSLWIGSLVGERSARQQEAANAISTRMGGSQTCTGPVLVIPYFKAKIRKEWYLLPEQLNVKADITPALRRYSIYDIVTYQSRLQMNGVFEMPKQLPEGVSSDSVLWRESSLVVGVTDQKGLQKGIVINFNGKPVQYEPGTGTQNFLQQGINSPIIDLQPGASQIPFDLLLPINGTDYLGFLPTARECEVNCQSPWTAPSFTGNHLPSNEPQIDAKGFRATWKVTNLNHNIPMQWTDYNPVANAIPGNEVATVAGVSPELSTGKGFGVKLMQPVNEYTLNDRANKYALLLIGLVFGMYLLFELLKKYRIHLAQYGLVGLAQLIFFLLLLAISEHTSFTVAYLIAAIATLSLLTWYTKGFISNNKEIFLFAGVAAAVYFFIYLLLQLEDIALLVGALGIFMIMTLVMGLLRKYQWFREEPAS